MKKWFSLFLVLIGSFCYAQAWSGVLAPARAVDWSHAGVPGGIPSATWTQCGSTISPIGSPSTPADPTTPISNVLNSCAANTYVQLAAGNFYLSCDIFVNGHNNVELRGNGANSTFLFFYGNNCGAPSFDECQGRFASVCFEGSDPNGNQTPSNTANWTAGYTQGTTVITLSAVTNLKVGNPIILDQLITATDTGAPLEAYSGTNTNPFVSPGSPGPYAYAGDSVRTGRGLTHVYTVKGCDGSTTIGHSCVSTSVTIDPPLEESYWDSSLSPGAWWATTPVRNAGVQNLSIDDTNSGCGGGNSFGVAFVNTVNTWQSGVRDVNECRAHTGLFYSARNTFRNNYMFLARFSTSTSYGWECFSSSDSLLENNISQAIASGFLPQEGCVGNVIGYNFGINDYYSGGGGGFGLAMSQTHGTSADLTLWEGNVGSTVESDIAHGAHNFGTSFRNRLAGINVVCWVSGPGTPDYAGYLASTWGPCTRAIRSIEYSGFSRYGASIGNVLGTTSVTPNYQYTGTQTGGPFVYLIDTGQNANGINIPDGSDPPTLTTLYRWGNCDNTNGGNGGTPFTACQFNSAEVPTTGTLAPAEQPWAQTVPSSHTLPASFYYSSKPSWWPSTKAWPPIGPDVTGGNISGVNGLAYTIPAQDCYLSLPGATTDGTGGPFPFDPSTCPGYGSNSSPATVPAPAITMF